MQRPFAVVLCLSLAILLGGTMLQRFVQSSNLIRSSVKQRSFASAANKMQVRKGRGRQN